MHQSIPGAVNTPPAQADLWGIFSERAKSPRQKMAATPRPSGSKIMCKKALIPTPRAKQEPTLYAGPGYTYQFVKGKGFLEVGTRSLAALTTFRFNTRLIVMMWQPEWNLNNSFVLSRTNFRFGMEVLWDNRHQPYTSLLWQSSCHGNQLEISITPLFWIALSTICISYVPRC